MLKHINSIEYFYFQIGGYFEGNRQIIIKDNYFELMKSQYGFSENILSKENHLTINSISSLIKVLNDISLLSWDENYSNEYVMDGTQWEIEIKYNNLKKIKKSFGSNQFPYVDKINNTISSKNSDNTPDFLKLIVVLNKIIKKKNFFY